MRTKKILISAVLIVLICVSFFYFGKICSDVSSEWNMENIETLNEKKTEVLALTAGVTGVSAALTLLPDDTCTPLAEELSDLISSFAVILSAILFEEYMVSITGLIGFRFIIPVGLAMVLLYTLKVKNDTLRNTGLRLATFGLALYLVIPASCSVIRRIEGTYDISVQSSLDAAQEAIDELNGKTDDNSKEKSGLLSRAADVLSGGVEGALTKVKDTINKCVESLALMIITCCFIPIGMVLIFIWLVKILLGIKITSPDIRKIAQKIPSHPGTDLDH